MTMTDKMFLTEDAEAIVATSRAQEEVNPQHPRSILGKGGGGGKNEEDREDEGVCVCSASRNYTLFMGVFIKTTKPEVAASHLLPSISCTTH